MPRGREDERYLSDPVGKPAEDIHRDDGQHKLGHLAMGLLLLLRLVLGPDRAELPNDEIVEDKDENQGDGEAQDESVQDERALSVQVLGLRPHDVAGLCVLTVYDRSVHYDWNHEDSAGGPRDEGHHLADEWGAEVGRCDGVTHSHVAVCRHDGEEDGAGELIDTGGRHVDLTHEVTKRPIRNRHRNHQKRYADEKTLIRDGQVHNVHVGDGLHLAEPQNHVDDKCVAQQPGDADNQVDGLCGEE